MWKCCTIWVSNEIEAQIGTAAPLYETPNGTMVRVRGAALPVQLWRELGLIL